MPVTMRIIMYIQSAFHRLARDNSGATASEYALLVTFIAIVAAGGMVFLGPDLAFYFGAVANGGIPNPSTIPTCGLGGC
jgi:Flp pilus assembly pilin Flp